MLNTKFGNARKDKKGYYVITSRKEGNHGKYLHRLIYENVYGEIPDNCIIHHKNKNPSDNCILNLELMTSSEHCFHHHNGFKHTKETKLKISENSTSTNYYRVYKHFNKKYKQGFIYRYEYKGEGQRKLISSVNINVLKEKVLAEGYDWVDFN